MTDAEDGESSLQQVATGAALVVMGLLALVLLAADVWWWWIAFPIGGGLIPLAQGLAMRYEADESAESDVGEDDEQAALDRLRSRYASGELTDAEFERRLERLLETETVEQARESAQRAGPRGRESVEPDGSPDRERETE